MNRKSTILGLLLISLLIFGCTGGVTTQGNVTNPSVKTYQCLDGSIVTNLSSCQRCPTLCDDNNSCTVDYCNMTTNYTCQHEYTSFSDFKKQLNNSKNISIVMDARSTSAGVVSNCASAIATSLTRTGKSINNLRYFAYEGERCFYSAGGTTINMTNSSISECESKLTNSVVFYIYYNQTKNSTYFCMSKAIIEGDIDFLNECELARRLS
jgi:hypothetical protein